MGVWLSPVQEPAPVPGTDLPPQSILKGIFCSSHCLVNIADLGQGHLADNLWWSRTLKPSLGSADTNTPACSQPPGCTQRRALGGCDQGKTRPEESLLVFVPTRDLLITFSLSQHGATGLGCQLRLSIFKTIELTKNIDPFF